MKQIVVKDKKFNLFIPHNEIIESIQKLALRIKEDYKNSEQPPVFLAVLNGAFMFTSELLKELEMECEISFIKVASYSKDQSSGQVKNLIGLGTDITNRDVIIVEDIVDTGNSITHITEMLKDHKTNSIEIATLFLKPDIYDKDIPIKYIARNIGQEFIVGFGLDYDQAGRNYKDIYKIADE